jgi:Asp-tRNA(Asn)/Glu-tRNA(Gln) amidotransferase A subunit family amidase
LVKRLSATFDATLTPTLRSVPPRHGVLESAKKGPEYAFTKPFSLAPGPALTLPVDAVDSLPVSAPLVSTPFAAATVLEVAAG